MTPLYRHLTSLTPRACKEALDWIGGRTAEQAWDESPRGDWLIWWGHRLGLTPRDLVRGAVAAARCAPQGPSGEAALALVERWLAGEVVTASELWAAAAAEAAASAAAAAEAAASAARAWAAASAAAASALEAADPSIVARAVRTALPRPTEALRAIDGRAAVSL